MKKRCPWVVGFDGPGSGVFVKSRLLAYSSRAINSWKCSVFHVIATYWVGYGCKYLEGSYYMAPDEGGEKPYALLFETMKQTKYYGIAKVAMHNREHVVILRPGDKGMILHTMYYADEVRRADEFNTDATNLKEKEV